MSAPCLAFGVHGCAYHIDAGTVLKPLDNLIVCQLDRVLKWSPASDSIHILLKHVAHMVVVVVQRMIGLASVLAVHARAIQMGFVLGILLITHMLLALLSCNGWF